MYARTKNSLLRPTVGRLRPLTFAGPPTPASIRARVGATEIRRPPRAFRRLIRIVGPATPEKLDGTFAGQLPSLVGGVEAASSQSGDAAGALRPLVADLGGISVQDGVLVSRTAVLTTAVEGDLSQHGTLAARLPALVPQLDAVLVQTAAMGGELPALTGSFRELPHGSIGAGLSPVSASLQATQSQAGEIGDVLPPMLVAVRAEYVYEGSFVMHVVPPTTDVAGAQEHRAVAATYLSPLRAATQAHTKTDGNAEASLFPIAGIFYGVVPATGSLVGTLSLPSLSATVTVLRAGVGYLPPGVGQPPSRAPGSSAWPGQNPGASMHDKTDAGAGGYHVPKSGISRFNRPPPGA